MVVHTGADDYGRPAVEGIIMIEKDRCLLTNFSPRFQY